MREVANPDRRPDSHASTSPGQDSVDLAAPRRDRSPDLSDAGTGGPVSHVTTGMFGVHWRVRDTAGGIVGWLVAAGIVVAAAFTATHMAVDLVLVLLASAIGLALLAEACAVFVIRPALRKRRDARVRLEQVRPLTVDWFGRPVFDAAELPQLEGEIVCVTTRLGRRFVDPAAAATLLAPDQTAQRGADR